MLKCQPTDENLARWNEKLEKAFAEGRIPKMAWKYVPRKVFQAGTWLHEELEKDGRYPLDEMMKIGEAFCRANILSRDPFHAVELWAERYLQ